VSFFSALFFKDNVALFQGNAGVECAAVASEIRTMGRAGPAVLAGGWKNGQR
jgi:hypothetical protein